MWDEQGKEGARGKKVERRERDGEGRGMERGKLGSKECMTLVYIYNYKKIIIIRNIW